MVSVRVILSLLVILVHASAVSPYSGSPTPARLSSFGRFGGRRGSSKEQQKAPQPAPSVLVRDERPEELTQLRGPVYRFRGRKGRSDFVVSIVTKNQNGKEREKKAYSFRSPYRFNFRNTRVIAPPRQGYFKRAQPVAVLQDTLMGLRHMNFIRTLEPQFAGHVRDDVNLTHVQPVLPLYRFAAITNSTVNLLQPSAYVEIVEGPNKGRAILRGTSSSLSMHASQAVQLSFEALDERGQHVEVARCNLFPNNPDKFDLFTEEDTVVEPYLLMCLSQVLASTASKRFHELEWDQDGTSPRLRQIEER